MTAYDLSNDLAVHVALDNTIVIDDVKEAAADPDKKQWRPLLLVVPLRLGLTDINPIYFADLKVRLSDFNHQSVRAYSRYNLVPNFGSRNASSYRPALG